MDKKALYTYNPSTDDFERYYPSLKDRLVSFSRIAGISAVIGGMLFVAVYFGFVSRSEEELREENVRLKSQYAVLERRVDASLKVMDKIRNRDDNLYRVMLQMDPMTTGRRYAGFDYEKSYAGMRRLDDEGLIERLSGEVDLLDRQLYSQIQSFDQLRSAAGRQEHKLYHIPATFPISNAKETLAAGFGMRRDPISLEQIFHTGLDFAVPSGTPVYATADGKVITAERKGGFGNCIDLTHGYNYMSRYAHLSEILVKTGQNVKRGELIGRSGSTGKSAQPHLHYEVWFKDEPQNPLNYCFLDLSPKQYSEILQAADDAAQVLD